jgi:fructose-specific phosphotransferase system IIC component
VDGEVPEGISQLLPVIGAGALLLAIALAARGIAQWARGEKAKP